jgi:hypothetical protein
MTFSSWAGSTDAAMFTANGEVVQPSEVLYKRPILVEPRHVSAGHLSSLRPAELRRDNSSPTDCAGKEPVVLAEMTLRSLIPEPESLTAIFWPADIQARGAGCSDLTV